MAIRYAAVMQFARDLIPLDVRNCCHRGKPVNCDCDTIAAELAGQDN